MSDETKVQKAARAQDGGIHRHALADGRWSTEQDGMHVHQFRVAGQLVTTEPGGAHEHKVQQPNSSYYEVGGSCRISWDGYHTHRVKVNGAEYETDPASSFAGGHSHEVLVDGTTESGQHTHALKLPGGAVLTSLLPGDFMQERAVAVVKRQAEKTEEFWKGSALDFKPSVPNALPPAAVPAAAEPAKQ
jgi:hypothetical protein